MNTLHEHITSFEFWFGFVTGAFVFFILFSIICAFMLYKRSELIENTEEDKACKVEYNHNGYPIEVKMGAN